jgi:chemotaxis signal transduction protein
VSSTDRSPSMNALQLRRAFDRTFSEARRIDTIPTDDFLAVRVGSGSFAIPLSEIAGLFARKTITRLPTPLPTLIGTAAFRGAILPVYDLARILGYASSGLSPWLVIAASEAVALTLTGFDGHLRLPRDARVAQDAGTDASQLHVREVARTPEGVRPIVHVPSVLATIRQQVLQQPVPKEP